jgi:hypothetical protein
VTFDCLVDIDNYWGRPIRVRRIWLGGRLVLDRDEWGSVDDHTLTDINVLSYYLDFDSLRHLRYIEGP